MKRWILKKELIYLQISLGSPLLFSPLPKWEVLIVICSSYVISKCGILPEWNPNSAFKLFVRSVACRTRGALSGTRILQNVTGAGNWTCDLRITGVIWRVGCPISGFKPMWQQTCALSRCPWHDTRVPFSGWPWPWWRRKIQNIFSSNINRQPDVFS